MIELRSVISTLGGRFPRARAEPPREDHSAGSHRLRFSRRSRHPTLQSLESVSYLRMNLFFICKYSCFSEKITLPKYINISREITWFDWRGGACMFQELGVQAMVNISSHLIFIIITWQLLRAVRIEEIFKKNRIVEARILIAFITIAIGSTVSHFFIDLIHWMQQILYIF